AALGASVLVSVNATNGLLQQSVPDEWRGRAAGPYALSFARTPPPRHILSRTPAERIAPGATPSRNRPPTAAPALVGPPRPAHPPWGAGGPDAQPEPVAGCGAFA